MCISNVVLLYYILFGRLKKLKYGYKTGLTATCESQSKCAMVEKFSTFPL